MFGGYRPRGYHRFFWEWRYDILRKIASAMREKEACQNVNLSEQTSESLCLRSVLC